MLSSVKIMTRQCLSGRKSGDHFLRGNEEEEENAPWKKHQEPERRENRKMEERER